MSEQRSPEALMAAAKAKQSEAFQRFIDTPAAKLMVSMIPSHESNPPELLRTLLESVHMAGFEFGLMSWVQAITQDLMAAIKKA